MFSKIRGQFNWRSGVINMAVLCVAGVVAGIAGGVALAQMGGANPTAATEAYESCTNEGSSYTCTPVPVNCANGGGCIALAGITVCDDSQSVEGCQTAFFDSTCGPAPDYQCQMQATYTGNCVDGTCGLGLAIPGICPGKELAQCQ
jgi:hypothetical protein